MRNFILVCLVGLVLLCGCIGSKTEELVNSYDKAGNRQMAIDFVKNSDSYKEDGKRLDCTDPVQQHGRDIWVIKCTFVTATDGSNHAVEMTIMNGSVKTAVLDGKLQMVS